MPNRKIAQAAAERRRKNRPHAERTYRQYGAQAHFLIQQLAGPTQETHDQAFERLRRMGEFVVNELLEALRDPNLPPIAAEEVISLLGMAGDDRAREVVWEFLQANVGDAGRVSTAALSLASLGDERALPYLRTDLESDEEEQVANAVAGLIMLGELDDIQRLRRVHQRYRANPNIRYGIANAILSIAGETDQRTFNRTLDEIRTNFADRHLWEDIWAILESEFGAPPHPVH